MTTVKRKNVKFGGKKSDLIVFCSFRLLWKKKKSGEIKGEMLLRTNAHMLGCFKKTEKGRIAN